MITIAAENIRAAVDIDGTMTLSMTVCKPDIPNVRSAYDEIKNNKLSVTIKKWRDKRSMDANAFLWVLCDGIAKVLKSTKEEVYRDLVRRVGVFEIIPIRADAVETFSRMWNGRGLGWFVDVLDDSKLEGYKKVMVYFGSSSYDTEQMSRLIDEAVQEAEGMGIPTLPEPDVKKMKEAWK